MRVRSNMDNALFDPREKTLSKGKVFQGGNFQHLHYLLGVQVYTSSLRPHTLVARGRVLAF